MNLKPGWLNRQFARVEKDVATWPGWMRREGNLKVKDANPYDLSAARRGAPSQREADITQANRIATEDLAQMTQRAEAAERSRKHTQEWHSQHYGKLQDWARKRLPEPWVTEFFNCVANGLERHDATDYFRTDTAEGQLILDQTKRAEDAELRAEAAERERDTALALIREHGGGKNSPDLEDAVRQVLQALIMDRDNCIFLERDAAQLRDRLRQAEEAAIRAAWDEDTQRAMMFEHAERVGKLERELDDARTHDEQMCQWRAEAEQLRDTLLAVQQSHERLVGLLKEARPKIWTGYAGLHERIDAALAEVTR